MQTSLHDMFFLGLPVVEKIARPILVYAFLVIALRLAGKRELAEQLLQEADEQAAKEPAKA